MKKHPAGSRNPFPSEAPLERAENPATPPTPESRSPLPEGWRRLATGLRGSRLYHVTRPNGGAEYWEGEMPCAGGRVGRRFASELQARAWLRLAAEPHYTLGSLELEEVHGLLRRVPGLAGGM